MKPHVRLAFSFFLIVLPIAVPISGAQTDAAELESAIALYRTGDYPQAKNQFQAVVKRRKKDLVAWHYLGLTLEALNEKQDARIAYEKAATFGENLFISRLKGMERRVKRAKHSSSEKLGVSLESEIIQGRRLSKQGAAKFSTI